MTIICFLSYYMSLVRTDVPLYVEPQTVLLLCKLIGLCVLFVQWTIGVYNNNKYNNFLSLKKKLSLLILLCIYIFNFKINFYITYRESIGYEFFKIFTYRRIGIVSYPYRVAYRGFIVKLSSNTCVYFHTKFFPPKFSSCSNTSWCVFKTL